MICDGSFIWSLEFWLHKYYTLGAYHLLILEKNKAILKNNKNNKNKVRPVSTNFENFHIS